MTTVVEVRTNLPDFRRQLAAMDAKMRKSTLRKALRAGANVYKAAVQGKAPVAKRAVYRPKGYSTIPGRLKFSIRVGFGRRAGQHVVRAFITPGSKKFTRQWGDPYYWRWLEGGWVPRGPGKRLRGGKRSVALQRARLAKAGLKVTKHKFVAPAFASAGKRPLDVFNEEMERGFRLLSRKGYT